jgi:murein DD-endopeptidase MepM/ murein hydrolase activator NlpD
VNQTTVRRIRQAVTGPALIGALACSAFVPDTAAADSSSPTWLVAAHASSPARVKIVRGLTVRPQAPSKVLPVDNYVLTARFNDSGGLWANNHTGLDFAAPEGTPLHAIGDAVVVSVGWDGAYGNKTVLRLGDGTVLWYCHQSRIDVTAGQHVSTGQVIGAIGATGNTTGPHLHLEVRPGGGDPVDPEIALANWGIKP